MSFGPTGTLHAISISFDNNTPRNAVLASRSTDGGQTWSDPPSCGSTTRDALGNNFNDKETHHRRPDRLALRLRDLGPPDLAQRAARAPGRSSVRSASTGPRGSRAAPTTAQTWEPARPIFDPKAQNQTIANQIVVLPDGTVVDGFTLLNGHKNAHGTRGGSVAILRSQDKGQTWDSKPTIVNSLQTVGVVDPDPNAPCPDPESQGACPVRTGDIIPDFAVDRSSGATVRGLAGQPLLGRQP